MASTEMSARVLRQGLEAGRQQRRRHRQRHRRAERRTQRRAERAAGRQWRGEAAGNEEPWWGGEAHGTHGASVGSAEVDVESMKSS